MSREEKVVYLDGRQSARGATRDVCERLRVLASERLGALLGHMLDNADDALFERAEKAESSQVQTDYFHAMRQLRLRRKELTERFQTELTGAFRRLLSPPAVHGGAGRQPGGSELSLLDNETLETSIAVESMIAKARQRCVLPLKHLELRLDHLLPGRRVDESVNPVDPQQIVGAFVDAAEILEIELSARLVVYKLFDKHVLSQLPGLCEELNHLLIELGVLPGLKGIPRPEGAPRPAGSLRLEGSSPPLQGGAETAASGAYAGAGAQGGEPLFDLLRQLMRPADPGQDAGWTGTGYASGGVPAASLTDVVAALSVLQRDLVEAPADGVDVKRLLGQTLLRRSGRRQTLGAAEDDTIDIVRMLFDVILEDPQLPASIKALIARLQIPVLKVAMLDRAFFSSSRHPARRLINEMAKAALGWIEPAQPERDPLYRQIDGIVERVTLEFDDDIGLFEEVLEEFLRFLDEEEERARLIEERTRQAAEGKAKVDAARRRVEDEIGRRLAGHAVPEVVRELLYEAWAKVLFISYLKEGETGEAWLRQLDVVDRLIWSVVPKTSAADRKQLLVEIPGLLHDLREGLNAILFNPFEMTRLFKALEAEHVRCLANSAAGGAAPETAAEEPEAAESASADIAAQPHAAGSGLADAEGAVSQEQEAAGADSGSGDEAELAEYIELLEGAAIGSWFELSQGSGQVRAKLSARLSGGRRLILVNRAGFKVADRSLEDFARELRDGRARLLDDNLLFERALETVITNLRTMREAR